MKTYSVTIQNKEGTWLTNWHKYFHPEEVDWDSVKQFCLDGEYSAYGYQYGTDSRNLTSARTRSVLWIREG